jgi:hypothetical protein
MTWESLVGGCDLPEWLSMGKEERFTLILSELWEQH